MAATIKGEGNAPINFEVKPLVDGDEVATVEELTTSIQESEDNLNDVITDKTSVRLFHVRDNKGTGSGGGGTFSSGAWRTRDLNEIVRNDIDGASLDSNAITLPAGKYMISASAPAYRVEGHVARLRRTSGTPTRIFLGTYAYVGDTSNGTDNRSFINGVFDLDEVTTLEVQHLCNKSNTGNGFGGASNPGIDAIYTEVLIWKI